MRIPKVIHFVWAGGERQLPKKNLQTVLDWAQKNPEFTVKIWVDPSSCVGGMRKIVEKYQYTYSEICTERMQAKKTQLQANITHLTFADISQLNNADKDVDGRRAYVLARREIDGLSPNYGLSSDLLRYAILYEEGGAYFDSDVYPGDIPLSGHALFETDFAENQVRLCVDPDSQGQGLVGNDAFICTSRNPQIHAILQLAANNCQGRNVPMNNIHEEAILSSYWESHGGSQGTGIHYYRFNKDREPIDRELQVDFTVRKTGPIVVRQIVCAAEDTATLRPHPNIQTMEATLRRVDADHTNDSAWVNSIVAKGEPLDMINKAVLAVRRDIENLGELRLSDTIRQLCHSLDVTVFDNKQYNDLLHTFLNLLHVDLIGVDLSLLSLIQADYFLPHLEEYCEQYNLPYDVKKSGFFPFFIHPNEPMPSITLAILNWNNDEAGRKLYHDVQQHLNDVVLSSLSSEAVNKQQVKRYLSMLENLMALTPSTYSEEDKVVLKTTIAHVREAITGLQSQNHAAELFGKGKNHHQEGPPNPGENNCCTIM